MEAWFAVRAPAGLLSWLLYTVVELLAWEIYASLMNGNACYTREVCITSFMNGPGSEYNYYQSNFFSYLDANISRDKM